MGSYGIVYQNGGLSVSAASGNTGDIDVSQFDFLTVAVNLYTLTGGTSPTVQFTVDYKTRNGTYIPMVNAAAAFNATGQKLFILGPGVTPGANNPIPVSVFGGVFPDKIRISWVTTGTPGAASAEVEIYGYGEN